MDAQGGAPCTAGSQVELTNDTLSANQVQGGAGGNGGNGGNAAGSSSQGGDGGQAGTGGAADGGSLFIFAGTLDLKNDTFSNDLALGGNGGNGGNHGTASTSGTSGAGGVGGLAFGPDFDAIGSPETSKNVKFSNSQTTNGTNGSPGT